MTNQNPLVGEVEGYDESTYTRVCECGQDTKMLFLYTSTEADKDELFRLQKYSDSEIPNGYSYTPIVCSPTCSNM